MPDKVSKIPQSETIITSCLQDGSITHIITSKLVGGNVIYTLYESSGGEFVRLGKGPSPLALEDKYQIWETFQQHG